MPIQTSRQVRKQLYLKNAEKMFEQLEDWYEANPSATLEELELEMRARRRVW